MEITLETSNAFKLELESGLIFRLRENGTGKLEINRIDEDELVVFLRTKGEQLRTTNEIILGGKI